MANISVEDWMGSTFTTEVNNNGLFFTNGPTKEELQRFYKGSNTNAADTTNTDDIKTGGSLNLALTGTGLTVGVYDIGFVLKSHDEFHLSTNDSTSRVSFPGSATITSGWGDHATHVAGTIGARGASATAEGMATAINIYSADVNASGFYDFDSTLTNSDWYNNANNFVTTNHSYGSNTGWEYIYWSADIGTIDVWYGIIEDHINGSSEDDNFGKYNSKSRNVDRAAYVRSDCLQCWAAGNDRNDSYYGGLTSIEISGVVYAYPIMIYSSYSAQWFLVATFTVSGVRKFTWNGTDYPIPGADGQNSGYDTLLNGGTTAKNVLTVGAINDVTADPITAINITTFTGYGPCDDGRIKPDVVGNGYNVYSCIATNDSAYATYSGTSMATPNVCGTAALLTEYYKSLTSNSTMRSATLRGLLCFTANNNLADSKPSYSLGYGVVDAKAAAEYLQNWNSTDDYHIKEYNNIASETTVSVTVKNVSNKIRALLVWNDYTDANTAIPSDAETDKTFIVTVSNNKFYIDGSVGGILTLYRGKTYTFDQSDSTNSGHPLYFSETSDGTHNSGTKYTSGFTESGSPGSATAYTKITIAADSPQFYYYCHNHSGYGNQATTAHYSSVDESRNPAIVNKLRLSGIKVSDSTTYYPYSLDKANPSIAAQNGQFNTTDNVQLMEFDATADTNYNIKVDFDQAGGHSITGTQPFTLFIGNATEAVDESAICFLKGTPVKTDQGEIPIEQITNKNTINGLNVVGIVKSLNQEEYMVNVTKNSLGANIPSQDTLITPTHGIYIDNTSKFAEKNGHLIHAKHLINDNTILKIDTGKIMVYNVLLKKHAPMVVNNMIVETLHPSHRLAVKFRIANHSKGLSNRKHRRVRAVPR